MAAEPELRYRSRDLAELNADDGPEALFDISTEVVSALRDEQELHWLFETAVRERRSARVTGPDSCAILPARTATTLPAALPSPLTSMITTRRGPSLRPSPMGATRTNSLGSGNTNAMRNEYTRMISTPTGPVAVSMARRVRPRRSPRTVNGLPVVRPNTTRTPITTTATNALPGWSFAHSTRRDDTEVRCISLGSVVPSPFEPEPPCRRLWSVDSSLSLIAGSSLPSRRRKLRAGTLPRRASHDPDTRTRERTRARQ